MNMVVIQNSMTWMHLTENWIYRQVRHLPPNVESHIVCKATKNLDQFRVPNIHCLADVSGWECLAMTVRGILSLGRRFRRHTAHLLWVADTYGACLVHSHFGYTGWRYMDPIERAGLRHVVTFYGTDVGRLPKEDPVWFERYREMFARIDAVLCEGPHMARCVAELGCPENKLRIQHLGVPLQEIPYRPRQWEPGSPLRVLMAASFREKKGIPYGLEALARIRDKVRVQVTLIGDANARQEGQAEKKKIMQAVERNKLASEVRFLGFQPLERLHQEAYQHHVFLSPSVTCSNGDTEGGAPVSVIEMAASGMPVVSSRHCDIPEVIEDRVGGLLADERDVDGLAECLAWLVAHPGQWGAMTYAARQRIEDQFDARKQSARLAALYAEVVAMGRPAAHDRRAQLIGRQPPTRGSPGQATPRPDRLRVRP